MLKPQTALNKILATKSQYFVTMFKKKDGTLRAMRAKLLPPEAVKNRMSREEILSSGSICVIDADKVAYRTIPLNRVYFVGRP